MEHVVIDCGTGEVGITPLTEDELAEKQQLALAGQAAEEAQVAEEANASALVTQAANALASNRAFLALNSPTNAQNAAQLRALTKQNNGIIRLLIRKLDGTD